MTATLAPATQLTLTDGDDLLAVIDATRCPCGSDLVIDLGAVRALDATSVAVLAETARRMARRHDRLRLRNARPVVALDLAAAGFTLD